MINNCISLTSLDLSTFGTKSATTMKCMFSGCSSLNYLNLSNFGNEENVLSEKINNLGMIEYEDIKIAINIIQS